MRFSLSTIKFGNFDTSCGFHSVPIKISSVFFVQLLVSISLISEGLSNSFWELSALAMFEGHTLVSYFSFESFSGSVNKRADEAIVYYSLRCLKTDPDFSFGSYFYFYS